MPDQSLDLQALEHTDKQDDGVGESALGKASHTDGHARKQDGILTYKRV